MFPYVPTLENIALQLLINLKYKLEHLGKIKIVNISIFKHIVAHQTFYNWELLSRNIFYKNAFQ